MESLVELRRISKAFSGVAVLEQVSLSVKPGTVHALIGGNGAGKSTLMKILAGVYQPDDGEVVIEGNKARLRSPSDAHSKGIYLVPQEPMLYPHMSVEENVLLAMPGRKRDYRDKLGDLMQSLNCDFGLDEMAGDLTIARQQQVELIRGLIREMKLIILDEPTSALTARESDALFEDIARLKREKGVSFVYITHRLSELFQTADEITILKDKKVVSNGNVSDYTLEDVLRIMVPAVRRDRCSGTNGERNGVAKSHEGDQPILEVRDFTGEGFSHVNLNARRGEVLGITGVVGAGRTEFAETLFGLRSKTSGTVRLRGKEIEVLDPSDAIRSGIAYLPENRHLHGVFLDASVEQNITSSILYRLSRWFTNRRKEESVCTDCIATLNIMATSGQQRVQQLSGGNQQKVVLGKWLSTTPQVVILDEPTRGIDAGSRGEIYVKIRRLAEEGIGVIVISSDFEEIVALCDRAVVMFNGRVIREIGPSEMSLENVTYSAFGYGTGGPR